MGFLIFFIFAGNAHESSQGAYRPDLIILFFLAYLVFLFYSYRKVQSGEFIGDSPWWSFFLLGAVIDFNMIPAVFLRLDYVENEGLFSILHGLSIIKVLALAPFLIVLVTKRISERVLKISFWTVVALLFVSRYLIIPVSPSPIIDVYTLMTMASDYLYSGVNPYDAFYPDTTDGAYGYAPALNYWPGSVLITLPFWLMGDVRGVSVFFECASLIFLWKLTKRIPFTERALLILLWLSFPLHLFVIENVWIEPVLCFGIIACTYFLYSRKMAPVGIITGLLLSIKQTILPMAGLLILFTGIRGIKPRLISTLIVAGVFIGISIPFIIWNPPAILENTITTFLTRPMRSDAFTIPAILKNESDVTISATINLIAYLLIIASAIYVTSICKKNPVGAWLLGLNIAYGLMFLFGQQAFSNYYYLVSCLNFLLILDLRKRRFEN